MIGLRIKHQDKIYQVGPLEETILCSSIVRKEFTLEVMSCSQGFVAIFQNLREGIEFEVEIAEFDEVSEPLSPQNPRIVEPGFPLSGPDWKLKRFQELEKVLKEHNQMM